MKKVAAALVLALAAAPALARAPVIRLTAGMHVVHAEVAADYATRAQGLMYRKSLASNAGMLFVFDEAARHCMWMKNTLIPLSVAFLDERGAIINIEEMQPQSEEPHCASAPARFALEMDRGWFSQRGFRAGLKIGGLGPVGARP